MRPWNPSSWDYFPGTVLRPGVFKSSFSLCRATPEGPARSASCACNVPRSHGPCDDLRGSEAPPPLGQRVESRSGEGDVPEGPLSRRQPLRPGARVAGGGAGARGERARGGRVGHAAASGWVDTCGTDQHLA